MAADRSHDRPPGELTPAQRKTTLKWQANGELTAIDMARVIDRLTNPQLNRCELQPEQP